MPNDEKKDPREPSAPNPVDASQSRELLSRSEATDREYVRITPDDTGAIPSELLETLRSSPKAFREYALSLGVEIETPLNGLEVDAVIARAAKLADESLLFEVEPAEFGVNDSSAKLCACGEPLVGPFRTCSTCYESKVSSVLRDAKREARGVPGVEALSSALDRAARARGDDASATLLRRLYDIALLLRAPKVESRVKAATEIATNAVSTFEELEYAQSPARLYAAVKQIDDLLGYPSDSNLRVASTIAEIIIRSPASQVFLEEMVTRAARRIGLQLEEVTKLVLQMAAAGATRSFEETELLVAKALSALGSAGLSLQRLSVTSLVEAMRDSAPPPNDEDVDDLVSPVFQGVSASRLRDSSSERAAAQLWEAQNTLSSSLGFEDGATLASWQPAWSTLGRILSRDSKGTNPSARDWLVASTVIQWLGSPTGLEFARQLLFATSPESKLAED